MVSHWLTLDLGGCPFFGFKFQCNIVSVSWSEYGLRHKHWSLMLWEWVDQNLNFWFFSSQMLWVWVDRSSTWTLRNIRANADVIYHLQSGQGGQTLEFKLWPKLGTDTHTHTQTDTRDRLLTGSACKNKFPRS